jgi:hypothetical protein
MAIRACFVIVLLGIAAPMAAAEPTIPADRVIGGVLGKPITAGDVGLTAPIDTTKEFDSRDDAMWNQMGRIQGALGGPIMERFVRERKIEVTAADVKRFLDLARQKRNENVAEAETKLAEIKKQLAGDDLSAGVRGELEKERQSQESWIAMQRGLNPTDSDFLKQMLLHWKTERELHRRYGGRVIFQQFGDEALDARKKLFEEAEKAGDLKFEDAGVRHLFYFYSNMRHLGFEGVSEQWRVFDEPK